MMEEEKDSITLWNLKIPIEKNLKAKIWGIVKDLIEENLRDDESLRDAIRNGVLRYKDFYIGLFRPVVKDILDDMELKARIYWDDEE